MAGRSLTYASIEPGTLEDRGMRDGTWLRCALSAERHVDTHVALELYAVAGWPGDADVYIKAEAYTAMWSSLWDP